MKHIIIILFSISFFCSSLEAYSQDKSKDVQLYIPSDHVNSKVVGFSCDDEVVTIDYSSKIDQSLFRLRMYYKHKTAFCMFAAIAPKSGIPLGYEHVNIETEKDTQRISFFKEMRQIADNFNKNICLKAEPYRKELAIFLEKRRQDNDLGGIYF